MDAEQTIGQLGGRRIFAMAFDFKRSITTPTELRLRIAQQVTDDDRIRLATRSGGSMLGPIERERCQKHRTRWVMFRWVWDADDGGDISGGNPEIVRSCAQCVADA